MRYHNITKADMLNGTGLRVVLWVAGCSHGCKGCHNQLTWDPNGGLPFDQEAKQELFESLEEDYISGITFSGGDPLYEANREEILALSKEIREAYPEKTIWLYTGFLWEDVKELEIIKYIDVLVDGKFESDKKDTSLFWKGSSNQRVIDTASSLEKNTPVLLEN